MQDLRQAHYEILLTFFLKEFVKLNVKADMIIKNVKLVELNTKIINAVLNTQTLNMIYQNIVVCVVTRIIKKSLIKT